MIVLCASGLYAEEVVCGWRLFAFQEGDGDIKELPDGINLAWIEVDGDKVFFKTSFADLREFQLKDFDSNGKNDNGSIIRYSASFAEGYGYIIIDVAIEDDTNNIAALSIIQDTTDISLFANFLDGATYRDLSNLALAHIRKGTESLETKFVKTKNDFTKLSPR